MNMILEKNRSDKLKYRVYSKKNDLLLVKYSEVNFVSIEVDASSVNSLKPIIVMPLTTSQNNYFSYRPPNTAISDYTVSLSSLIDVIQKQKKCFYYGKCCIKYIWNLISGENKLYGSFVKSLYSNSTTLGENISYFI